MILNNQNINTEQNKTKDVIKKKSNLHIERVLMDYKEILNNPLKNIEVFPFENLFFDTWHIILSGPNEKGNPWAGLRIHLVLNFRDNYPLVAPEIKVSYNIPHPNIFSDGYICLDMIKNQSYYDKSAWSPSYSIYSILMQLQSFLFSENIPQEHGGNYKNDKIYHEEYRKQMLKNMNNFKCSHCRYGMEISPTFEINEYSKKEIIKNICKISEIKKSERCYLLEIPKELLILITDFLLSTEDLIRFTRCCKILKEFEIKNWIWKRRETICYVTKKNFKTEILGFGLNMKILDNGKIVDVNVFPDFISGKAFYVDKINLGVYGDSIQYWIPIPVNHQHAKNAMKRLQSSILSIMNGTSLQSVKNENMNSLQIGDKETKKITEFDPLFLLSIIPKMMNQLVVSIMD